MLSRVMAIIAGFLILFPAAGLAVIHDISISGFEFVPGNQTITQGDTVRWTNLDPFNHTATSDAGLWDSGTLLNGQSYELAFDNAGVFPYHCAIHISMKDTLTVVPAYDLQIEIGDNFFSPGVVRIEVGQTIRWHNGGAMDHTSTATGGLWDSGTIPPGGVFDFAFGNEGVYDYVCVFHAEMNGTVVVGRPDTVVADIDIADFTFNPNSLDIIAGQNVRWINFDETPHTTTENGGLWDSGTLEAGDFFILKADSAGPFDYICSIHPTMVGFLNVIDTSTTGCVYVPGDINGNGTTNGIDVGFGVNYFKGGPVPPIDCGGICPESSPFYAAGDVNGNCVFNGIDVSYFVNYLKGIVPSLQFCADCAPASR